MDLSASYREAQRPTFAINDGVDFRGSTALADADRLIFLPVLPRSPRGALSRRCYRSDTDYRIGRQLIENSLPDASAGPTVEPPQIKSHDPPPSTENHVRPNYSIIYLGTDPAFVAAFFCHSMPLTLFFVGVGFLISPLNPSQIRNVLA